MRPSLAPLRVSAYRRLLFSYAVNELGDSIAIVALAVLVFDRSDSPLAIAGLFVAAKFLPAFITPAIVARTDQLHLARVLGVLYAAEAAIFAALAFVAAKSYSYPLVLGLALLDGTLALTARALSRGGVARVLETDGLLRQGNALLNVAFGLAAVTGMVAGGLIVSTSGVSTGLAVDAASFAIAALIVLRIRPLTDAQAEPEPFLERFRDGLRHVRTHPVLPLLLAGQALALVCFYLVIPIEVVYAKETLGVGDAGFGVLLASWSAGILLGSLLYIRLSLRSPVALVILSTATIGLAYAGMAAADELWVACALSVVGGLGNGFQWVSVMTMLQEATPLHLQARVVGLLESIGAAMPGVGFLLGGALATIWSPRVAYAAAGAGVLAVALIGAALLPRRAGVRPRPRPAAPSGGA